MLTQVSIDVEYAIATLTLLGWPSPGPQAALHVGLLSLKRLNQNTSRALYLCKSTRMLTFAMQQQDLLQQLWLRQVTSPNSS